jgi:AcrR family transcriptional regulator
MPPSDHLKRCSDDMPRYSRLMSELPNEGQGPSARTSPGQVAASAVHPSPEPPDDVRSPLTREAIVDAALAIIDREGLDAVSMRAVANELDAGAASLYWHVANKDELFDLVLDRVVGEVSVPRADPAAWQDQLAEMVRDTRAVLTRHPGVARLTFGRAAAGSHMLAVTNGILSVLRGAGLPDRAAAFAASLLWAYVTAHVLEEQAGSPARHGSEGEGWPRPDADARFEFGLATIVAGLTVGATRPHENP